MKALFFENRLDKIVALKAASVFNKHAALGKLSPLRYADIKEPQIPNQRWLKVKNTSCGLCGTDLHFMFMDMDPKCFTAAVPGISRKFLGHELIGEVVETGSEVDSVKTGDRVAMRIDWPSCNQLEISPPCEQCKNGNYMLCENLGLKNLPEQNIGGGFSPYMVMHNSQPFVIPQEIDNDKALLLEPLASATHGILKAEPKSGNKVLILGAGTIGLMSIAAIKGLFHETEVYCLSRYDFQSRIASKLGANIIQEGPGLFQDAANITNARYNKGYFGNEILLGGFDIIYDTVGNDKSLSTSLRLCKAGGKVVLIGINFTPGKIDYTPIWNQEITLVGINCHATEYNNKTSFNIAANLLSKNAVDPKDIISHRYPVSKYKEAVKTFLSKSKTKATKIVFDHQ